MFFFSFTRVGEECCDGLGISCLKKQPPHGPNEPGKHRLSAKKDLCSLIVWLRVFKERIRLYTPKSVDK